MTNANLHALPVDERKRLVEDLWDSIAADQSALPLTDAQRRELDSRLDAYEVDRDPGRQAREAVVGIQSGL